MGDLQNTSGPVKPTDTAIKGGGATGTPPQVGGVGTPGTSKSELLPDHPEKLVKADANIYNANGYVGVDPQYQNGSTTTVKPL